MLSRYVAVARPPLPLICCNFLLKHAIASIPNVKIVDKNYNLLVSSKKKNQQGIKPKFRIYLPNGTLLAEMPSDRVGDRIKLQLRIRKLINLTYPASKFNVFVDLIYSYNSDELTKISAGQALNLPDCNRL